ncbi:hypothetical protein AB0454_22685 [Streptomyces sp. NPDC093509]|uniref:hypothetical protein n=1 Tax=Streptomyces sp. NPDC093509 TaxID=3154982 RepID=UPI00344EA9C4
MSSHDIPTEPQEDPAETIMAALAHGMNGDRQAGLALLKPFFDTPRTLVSLCAALAEGPASSIRPSNPNAEGVALIALRGGKPANIQDAPAGHRFAAQFTSVWANGDKQTAYALFDALHGSGSEEDADAVAEGVFQLYEMSVAWARSLTNRPA